MQPAGRHAEAGSRSRRLDGSRRARTVQGQPQREREHHCAARRHAQRKSRQLGPAAALGQHAPGLHDLPGPGTRAPHALVPSRLVFHGGRSSAEPLRSADARHAAPTCSAQSPQTHAARTGVQTTAAFGSGELVGACAAALCHAFEPMTGTRRTRPSTCWAAMVLHG